MDAASAKHVGARLLDEIEEESLEELLAALRIAAADAESATTAAGTTANTAEHHYALNENNTIDNRGSSNNSKREPQPPPQPTLPIPALQNFVRRYQTSTKSVPPPLLSVSGRYLPFLYHLISLLLLSQTHRYTVAIIDPENRFDVTRLVSPYDDDDDDDDDQKLAAAKKKNRSDKNSNKSNKNFLTEDDLKHIYVFNPPHIDPQGQTTTAPSISIMESVKSYMLYGQHSSRDREFWGTIVINPTFSSSSSSSTTATAKGDVVAGFKGWLRIDRDEVPAFPAGMSVEEALAERSRRQEQVEKAPWVASCAWGGYAWREEKD